MKYSRKIKSALENLRGIKVLKICKSEIDKSDEDLSMDINYQCYCPQMLEILLECSTTISIFNSMWFDRGKITYTLTMKHSYAKEFLSYIEDLCREDHHCGEFFEDIHVFKKLNNKAKTKYINYIKFLRSISPEGCFDMPALMLLNSERLGGRYLEEEYYTRADEVRAILEFNKPEDTYDNLIEISMIEE